MNWLCSRDRSYLGIVRAGSFVDKPGSLKADTKARVDERQSSCWNETPFSSPRHAEFRSRVPWTQRSAGEDSRDSGCEKGFTHQPARDSRTSREGIHAPAGKELSHQPVYMGGSGAAPLSTIDGSGRPSY